MVHARVARSSGAPKSELTGKARQELSSAAHTEAPPAAHTYATTTGVVFGTGSAAAACGAGGPKSAAVGAEGTPVTTCT